MDADASSLFRQDAIDARRAPLLAEPLLPNPLSHSLAALAALIFLVVAGGLVTQLEVPRRATVRGYIAPDLGVVRVHAPIAATLAALEVHEGEHVVAGQPLAALTAPTDARREPEGRRDLVLRAPVAGTVTALAAQAGAAVGPTRPLLMLLPDGARLEARLLVPSRDAGFLQPGQDVTLRLDAFPYQRFGAQRGRVRGISRAIQLPGEVDAPIATDEPTYAVVVGLGSESVRGYGREWPLRPGLALDADLILERMPLYRRLLDPVLALGRAAQ